MWSVLSCALQGIVSCYMASWTLDSLKGIMKWQTRWLRKRQKPSILLAAYIHYYFWDLPWVRQSAKHPREDLDTENCLKNSKIIFVSLMQPLALPSVLFSTNLSFSSQQRDAFCSGKVRQKVPALQLPSCWWHDSAVGDQVPGDLCHLFPCTSLISRVPQP